VDRNLKLILGLVWTLILHYSLSHRHFSADDENTDGTSENEKKETPKQRLLAWIQAKLPHHPVSNFTSNWNNGILLGALVNYTREYFHIL
jgi:filamin